MNTFLNNDFEHKRDSDYVNSYIDKIRTIELIRKFSKVNKLFPIYINKINISLNLQILDIYTDIIILTDEEWKHKKILKIVKEYLRIKKHHY